MTKFSSRERYIKIMMINLAYVALRQEEPWIQLRCWATNTSQGMRCVAPNQARETKRPGFLTKTIWEEEAEPFSPALVWEAPGNRFLFILSYKVILQKKKMMISLFILTRLEAKELNFIASENEGKVLLTDYWWKFKELQVFLGKIWQWLLKTT